MNTSCLKPLCFFVLLFLSLSSMSFAAVPQTINYQGYLKEVVTGAPVSGPVSMTFALYEIESGGTPLWSEIHAVVPISNGIYNVRLGSINPSGNPLNLPFDRPYYLSISVNGEPEMAPRQAFTSVPYAMKSITVETVPCNPGDSLTCYTGPDGTKNIGNCRSGIRTCSPSGVYGTCVGEVLSVTEICFNDIDDNCNGQTDENCTFPNGSVCSQNKECVSGFCADGFCCNSACSGTCQSCGLPGTEGACINYSVGTDPEASCMPYTCNGSGTCSTTCVSDASCVAGFYCNPANQCLAKLATGAICGGNSQCMSGYCVDGYCCNSACNGLCETCSDGTCTPIATGQDPANECPGIGTCGGVCNGVGGCGYPPASTLCGTCQRCSGNGLCLAVPSDTDPDNSCSTCTTCDGLGSCKNVANGLDPQNDCSDQGPCGLDGWCKGDGTCRYYSSATIKTPESCNAGSNIYTYPDMCTGTGGVNDGGTAPCMPYICGTSSCKTTCTQQSDCATGYFCDTSGTYGQVGACLAKSANGSVCSNDANDFECSGGFCSNGFCCSSSTGSCCASNANCSFLNQSAVCDSAATCTGHRVDAVCSANICQTSSPSDPSACSGQICVSGSCTSNVWTPQSTCNGSGACTMSGSIVGCDDGNACTNDACIVATGCFHANNSYSTACYTGTPGTENVGLCHGGTKTCSGGSFGACIGEVVPATEICGGNSDENCNGQINEQNASGCTWYRLDADQDSYGVSSNIRCYCSPGLMYLWASSDNYTVANSGASDCNDANASVNPGQVEKCSTAYDDNCDGQINEEGAQGCTVFYYDADQDGYGTSTSKCLCAAAYPYTSLYSTDCNDLNASIYPGRAEVCNGIDDNCNGQVDQNDVPIGTICPATANVTATTCSGASGCKVSGCSQYWFDIDTVYSNGCEVQQDLYDRAGQGNSCANAASLSTLYEMGYGSPYFVNIIGNSVPAGDVDWYLVNTFDNSGDGTIRFDVRFGSNPGNNYRFDVYLGSCSVPAVIGQINPFFSATRAGYYIRVYRASGVSPLGETYQLTVSNGLY